MHRRSVRNQLTSGDGTFETYQAGLTMSVAEGIARRTPTTNTLSRYFTDHQDGPPEINFEPSVTDEEVRDTLELCAVAGLGVIVAVNQVMGTQMDLDPMADEFLALQKKPRP